MGQALRDLKKNRKDRLNDYIKALTDLQIELNAETQRLTGDIRAEVGKLSNLISQIEQSSKQAGENQADIEAKASDLKTQLEQFEKQWGGLGQNLGNSVRSKLAGFLSL